MVKVINKTVIDILAPSYLKQLTLLTYYISMYHANSSNLMPTQLGVNPNATLYKCPNNSQMVALPL